MLEKEPDDQNYKGLLQQRCQLRGIDPPTYGVTQCGSSHQPSWLVTVEYGDESYKTPAPIAGSRKMAEQIAAKQIIKEIDAPRDQIMQSIGWLAREGKLTIREEGRRKIATLLD